MVWTSLFNVSSYRMLMRNRCYAVINVSRTMQAVGYCSRRHILIWWPWLVVYISGLNSHRFSSASHSLEEMNDISDCTVSRACLWGDRAPVRPVGRRVRWVPSNPPRPSTQYSRIQSPCVAITARIEAISLSGVAFWLELKMSVVRCMDHITKRGKSTSLYKSLPCH